METITVKDLSSPNANYSLSFLEETTFSIQPDDEIPGLWHIEDNNLGIDLYLNILEETHVLEELAEEIFFLWEEYACEEDNNLSPAARKIKNNLLNILEAHE